MEKCLIAMSGGVDSTVAAVLLAEQGFDCIGCTMLLCPDATEADTADARLAAGTLRIPFYILDGRQRFREKVMDSFAEEYRRGRTPNPCVQCNRYLKFDTLLEFAKNHGCETIATGHYAKIEQSGGRFLLKKAADEAKDQSYYLWALTQEQLRHVRFPLGDRTKEQARAFAEAHGMQNAHKSDSQDICFVPDGDYADFLRRYTGKAPAPGNFITEDGTVLGRHRGILHYTIGQRKGLGIAWAHPLYVLGVNPEENTVTLGKNEGLFSRELWAEQVNFVSVPGLDAPVACCAKIRSRHREQPCTASVENGRLHVVFDQPQRAITPGQSVVLYAGDTVLAGGIICVK